MTIRRISSALLLVSPLLVAITGCQVGGDLEDGLEAGLACLFDDLGYRVAVPSDDGLLRAAVDCEKGSDCVDRRTIQSGAHIDFTIEVPEKYSKGLSVKSDPEGVLEVEGFSDEPEQCDDAREISGTITFSGEGEGAFVVLSEGEEIDRFTVDVQRPSRVEIQFSAVVALGDHGDWESRDVIHLKDDGSVRAIVRGTSGDRLVGGPAPQWSIDHPDIASFLLIEHDEDSGETEERQVATATGYIQYLIPATDGETTLAVTAGELEATLPLAVGSTGSMGGASSR